MIKLIKKHKNELNKNTIKTIKGQVLSGDIEGAYAGLMRVLNE